MPTVEDLESVTPRAVAAARYKRNHEFIAELFSPFPPPTHPPMGKDQPEEQLTRLRQLIEKEEEEMRQSKVRSIQIAEKMDRLTEDLVPRLKQLDNVQDVKELEHLWMEWFGEPFRQVDPSDESTTIQPVYLNPPSSSPSSSQDKMTDDQEEVDESLEGPATRSGQFTQLFPQDPPKPSTSNYAPGVSNGSGTA